MPQQERGTTVSKTGLVALIAGGVIAGALGLAGPASATSSPKPTDLIVAPASVDHLGWIDQLHPRATAPHVDTSVRQSR